MPATEERKLPAYWSVPTPERTPERMPVVTHGPPRERIILRDAPTLSLPGMPDLAPADNGDGAALEAALRAVSAAEAGDAQTQAVGNAVRVAVVGVVAALGASFAWVTGAMLWGWGWATLPAALLLAALVTFCYALVTEAVARRYTAAGVERLKIQTAAEIHRDRLETRRAMHADAVGAWERTLARYLDTWEKGQQ